MSRSFHGIMIILVCFLYSTSAQAADPQISDLPQECAVARDLLATFLSEPSEKIALHRMITGELASGMLVKLQPAFCKGLLENAVSKQRSFAEGVSFCLNDLTQSAILFERFRLETYLSSGVLPKRYFGFLDGQGKTAEYERKIRDIGSAVEPVLNEYAASRKSEIRVTAKEIVVTFLAEGGSLLLTDEYESVDRAHPVRHVGLDDYRKGFAHYPGLLELIDARFGTRLQYLSVTFFGRSTLLRPMTFAEAILSTGVMYLYEKELAEAKRMKSGLPSLMSLPLDQQFIHTSLVYNSGILFSDERMLQILNFETKSYLLDVNQKNLQKRPQLPIPSEEASLKQLEEGGNYPRQLTSWSAVYHILQRYGAWVALERFTSLFDEFGRFRLGPDKAPAS